MDNRIILIKCITLIYRCRLVNNIENDDLIRTILNTIKTDTPEFNFTGTNYIKLLKDFALVLLEEKEIIVKDGIFQHLGIILESDNKLLSIIKESVDPEYDDPTNKRIVTSLIKLLNNYYKEHLAVDILSKVTYDLKFNRSKITNFGEYLQNTISQLEPLTATVSSIKDPALVNEIDFEHPDSLSTVFEEVRNLNNNNSIYKLGWQGLNKAISSGIRRGELITIGALQHKYKTGFSLSLFMQIALHNKPIISEKEKDKKPLLLRISFEDSLTNNLQFMYQYLKASDGEIIKIEDFDNLTSRDMTNYILSKMTVTGFHVKMMRVDPSQWTYLNIFNKIIELEAQGYAVHVLMLDYVGMLPTTGCTQGPIGTDKRDLLRRLRNFCSARNIALISPLQLSTEAKQLIRNGVPEHQLVNEIAEKGYYSDSKQLDQEIDLELYLHLFTHKRRKYLAVRRGKHRLPTVIDDEDKYFILKFPGLNIPILPDLDKEDTSMKKLPKEGCDENVSGNLLNEILN